MDPIEITPPPVPQRDRRTRLIFAGVIELIVGGLLVLSTLASVAAQAAQLMQTHASGVFVLRSAITTGVMMGLLATVFIVVGVGTIRTRRWARAIGLCVASVGLIAGVLGCGFLVWSLPAMEASMRTQLQNTGQPVGNVVITGMAVMMVIFTFLFYVALPGVLLLLYRGREVKLTCETRDPVPRWTDRCPLPVLAIVLLQISTAIGMISIVPMFGGAFPIGGFVVHGWSALLVILAIAILLTSIAIGLYRLRIAAWWGCVATVILFAANAVLSFTGTKLIEFYAATGMPEAQLAQVRATPLLQGSAMATVNVAGAALLLGYLVWLRRFFRSASTA